MAPQGAYSPMTFTPLTWWHYTRIALMQLNKAAGPLYYWWTEVMDTKNICSIWVSISYIWSLAELK